MLTSDIISSEVDIFGIFKGTSGLRVFPLRNEIIIDKNIIPDLSIGIWRYYWSNNNLNKELRNRVEYIYSNSLLIYLSKVKQLKLTHENKNKILEDIQPKPITS